MPFMHEQYVHQILIMEAHHLLQRLSQILEHLNYDRQHICNFGSSDLDGIVPTTEFSYSFDPF
jgi:hypothetical protein